MRIDPQRLIEQFIIMAKIPSESGHERAMGDYLVAACSQRGWKVSEDQAAAVLGSDTGNILVQIPGNVEAPTLLFSAHMDTVSPGIVKEIISRKDCLFSNGTSILGADDKAGIAAILEAVDTLLLSDVSFPPLELLFTVGEEVGLSGAGCFDYSQIHATYGYVLDHGSAPGAMVLRSPAQYHMTFTVEGKAAHAGMCPELGLNAIQIMGQALLTLPTGRIDEETTCNFGKISGGLAHNIVCPSCTLEAEARSLDPEKLERLVNAMIADFTEIVEKHGAKAIVQKEFIYAAAQLQKEDPAVQIATQAAEVLGLAVKHESTGGGSDASVINEHGIACVNLGIGMSKVHTQEEFIRIQDLVDSARWVLEIIRTAGRKL